MHYSSYIIKVTLLTKALFLCLFLVFSTGAFAQSVATYDEAIVNGDRSFKSSQWLDAKAYYQQALKLKPDDDYAQSQIDVIIEKMKSNMEAEDLYYDIVDHADDLFEQNKIDEAISQYQRALEIIPNDEYASNKIKEIREFRQREKDRIDSFNKAIETGKVYLADSKYDEAIASFTEAAGIFPANETPLKLIAEAKEKKEEFLKREADFNELFEEGERYVLIQNYIEAVSILKKADSLFPENTVADARIKEVSVLADKQRRYERALEKADDFYVNKDFVSAKTGYIEADKIWSGKGYATDMIEKIDLVLEESKKDLENNYQKFITSGDSLLNIQQYELARGEYNLALNLKPNESYPKKKLSEINAVFAQRAQALEKDYQKIVASADSSLNAGAYDLAKATYNTALDQKPDDTYPQKKIEEINSILAELAVQQELDNKYNQLIGQGDLMFSNRDYESAIEKYNEAKAIKPVETYPDNQIMLVNKAVADVEKQKQIDAEYENLVQTAAALLNADNFGEAKVAYNSALELKPYEAYPKQQLILIDSLVVEKQRREELQRQYNELVTSGDEATVQENFEGALSFYTQAVELMPDEIIAARKKTDTEAVIAEIKRQEELQRNYDNAIARANELFNNESYELAKTEYENSLNYKPDESYPKEKIALINIELERLAAEREERYAKSIASGDSLLEVGNYRMALASFKTASSIKSSETYPKQKITEVEKILEEQRQRMMARYTIVIADADKYYNSRIYDKAIEKYSEAISLLPDEDYPRDMVNKITKFIEENAIVDIIKSSDTIVMNATDRYDFEPVVISVRKSNYIFMRARSLDGNPCKLIVSYGSENGRNGGFVIQVEEGDDFKDYISRVGNQYKWFSEDNNWITIHPENGDVDISLMRISSGE